MAKKLKVWLNNKLNKSLHCTTVIKFYRIFVTELVLRYGSSPHYSMDIFWNCPVEAGRGILPTLEL